jgi:GxxExxY protein
MTAKTETLDPAEFYNHKLSAKVIGSAIEVHRQLGPGLLESVYQKCLAHEMQIAGLKFHSELEIPIHYKGVSLDCAYRLDFLVEDFLVVEVKALNELLGIHQAQLLTYMRLCKKPIGLLLNFNVTLLKDGIRKSVLADL